MTARRFVRWAIARGPWLWLAALLLVVPAGVRTASLYLRLSSDLEQLLPRQAPSVLALQELRRRMRGLQHLGVLVDHGSPPNARAAERLIDDLAARVRRYPPGLVRRVQTGVEEERRFSGWAGAIYIQRADLEEIRRRLAERKRWEFSRKLDILLEDTPPPPLDLSDLEQKYAARTGGLARFPGDRFTSTEVGASLLLIEVGGDFSTGLTTARELARRLEGDLAALGGPQAYAPGLRVGLTGEVAIQLEEVAALAADLSVASILVVLGVIAALLLYYRWWRAIPLLFLPLIVAATGAFAVASLPPFHVRQLNSNTAFLGSIIVGNGINFGVILLARYLEARRRGEAVEPALVTAVAGTRSGTLVAALAASASYGSLIITRFPGFRQFGMVGALGMVLSWAAPFLLMPWLATRLDRGAGAAPRLRSSGRLTAGVARAVTRHPRFLAGVGLAITLLAIPMALRALDLRNVETDFSRLRRRDTWTSGERYWGGKMDRMLGRNLAPTVLLTDSPEEARALAARVREAAARPPLDRMIAEVRGLDDVLPRDQEARLAALAAIRRLLSPATRASLDPRQLAEVDRFLAAVPPRAITERDLPTTLKTGLEERDGRLGAAVLVFPRPGQTWRADQIALLVGELRRLAAGGPGRPARVAGALPISAAIVDSVQHDGRMAAAAALASAVLLVVVMFRGSRLGLYVVGSLVTGVLWMLAISRLAGVKINFANVIAFPITFGIGVDYAVNLMSRYLQEGERNVAAAITSTGSAVALCSATTIIGYSSLLLAKNQGLFLFGLLAVIGEVTCLVAGVVLLPAVLLTLDRRHGRGALA
jgi:predicted RND superfamily exporter protein